MSTDHNPLASNHSLFSKPSTKQELEIQSDHPLWKLIGPIVRHDAEALEQVLTNPDFSPEPLEPNEKEWLLSEQFKEVYKTDPSRPLLLAIDLVKHGTTDDYAKRFEVIRTLTKYLPKFRRFMKEEAHKPEPDFEAILKYTLGLSSDKPLTAILNGLKDGGEETAKDLQLAQAFIEQHPQECAVEQQAEFEFSNK